MWHSTKRRYRCAACSYDNGRLTRARVTQSTELCFAHNCRMLQIAYVQLTCSLVNVRTMCTAIVPRSWCVSFSKTYPKRSYRAIFETISLLVYSRHPCRPADRAKNSAWRIRLTPCPWPCRLGATAKLASPQGLFARQRFLGHKRNMGYATRFNRAIGSLSGWNSPAGSRLACSQR